MLDPNIDLHLSPPRPATPVSVIKSFSMLGKAFHRQIEAFCMENMDLPDENEDGGYALCEYPMTTITDVENGFTEWRMTVGLVPTPYASNLDLAQLKRTHKHRECVVRMDITRPARPTA